MPGQMFCATCERKTLFEARVVRERFEVEGKLVEVEGLACVCTVCGTPRGDSLFDGLLVQARGRAQ